MANRLDVAERHLRAAFALCDEAGASHDRARVAAALGMAVWQQGRIDEAIELMEGAFAVLAADEQDEDVGDARGAARPTPLLRRERPQRRSERIETAIDIGERLVLPAVLSSALNTKSLLLQHRLYEARCAPATGASDRARPRPRLRGPARLQQPRC